MRTKITPGRRERMKRRWLMGAVASDVVMVAVARMLLMGIQRPEEK
jgi:hypothetical protein